MMPGQSDHPGKDLVIGLSGDQRANETSGAVHDGGGGGGGGLTVVVVVDGALVADATCELVSTMLIEVMAAAVRMLMVDVT